VKKHSERDSINTDASEGWRSGRHRGSSLANALDLSSKRRLRDICDERLFFEYLSRARLQLDRPI